MQTQNMHDLKHLDSTEFLSSTKVWQRLNQIENQKADPTHDFWRDNE